MAVTQAVQNNKAIRFRNEFIRELVRQNMFSPYMGSAVGSLIRTMTYAERTGGDQINIPFGKSLHAPGVSTGLLSGQEEQIENSGFRIWIDWLRNAVKIPKSELKKMSVDIYDYARPMLADWGKVTQRDDIVQALMAIPGTSAPLMLGQGSGQRVNGTLWANASEAQKSAWVAMNIDRIVFGQLNSNYVAGSFSSSLANLTATNSRASAGILRLLKKKAETASPQITPLNMDDGYDRVVVFCGPNAFRDFEADPLIFAANKDARPREGLSMNKNPIFNDGDLLYHGCIVRKVPQIDKYLQFTNANGVQCAPIFLVGQSGLVMPWGQLPKDTELDDTDYQFYDGKGIEFCYGIGKAMFTEVASSLPSYIGTRYVDWGVATGFVASPDDA
jgi:hypothetical protein